MNINEYHSPFRIRPPKRPRHQLPPRPYRAEQNFQPERSPLLPINYTDVIITCIAGLLQLSVAGYAFRLTGRFGVVRIGWSLFSAFALLAMVHLIESVKLFAGG